jgi:two-component system sensor histidine kinase KdpD
VAEALGELGRRADGVRVEGRDALDPVSVDRGQVRRVLVNLLENALRHSPAGEPVVVRLEPAGAEVRIAVVDGGPGVGAPDRERVFEPFTRVGGVHAGGTGLGLAIARGFAESNGCRLAVEDVEDGCCFALRVPIASPGP